MPGVVRQYDITSGEGCFPPEIPTSWSPDVYANNRNVVRQMDMRKVHCCGYYCHVAAFVGTHSVYVNNRCIQVEGDPLTCGDTASMHSMDVIVE